MKALNFYGRFLLSFTAIGYAARGLPVRPVKNRLDGQTWLVTGATGGIGRAIALEAATRGAKVYAVGRRKDALEELSSSCPPRSIMPIVSDLSLVRENLAPISTCWSTTSAFWNRNSNLRPKGMAGCMGQTFLVRMP